MSETADDLADLARAALASGEEEAALPKLQAGAEHHKLALLWQWKALLERSLDEHEAALRSFRKASELDPADVSIAHGLAQTTMEAGLPAVEAFEHVRRLAPQNGQVLVGLAAARAAVGDGPRAVGELERALEGSPLWVYGHEQLAQLRATLGQPRDATASLERAIARAPRTAKLWETLLSIELRRGAYAALPAILERARRAGTGSPEFQIYEGIAAAELDPEPRPHALFGPSPPAVDQVLGTWRIRHLLRVGEVYAALPLIDRELQRNQGAEIWSYAATAWRLTNDPRSQWLEGDERLVGIFDLADDLPPLAKLADTLRALHIAKGEYLDQSVRGGTQTDGPLLSRIDPTIRALRAAIVGAVQRYVAQLPTPDLRHPLLNKRRDRRVRFSGSWSVRLRSGGNHANHVHPQGWISSALYVALPARTAGEAEDAGWLTLGEPDEKLQLKLGPWRKVQPKPGQLVLFPSHMWHGTRPFSNGERLTVAFDVRPPI